MKSPKHIDLLKTVVFCRHKSLLHFHLNQGNRWAQTAVGLGLGAVLLLSSAQSAITQSSPPAPAPTPFESVEFSSEDVLNPAASGFQAIYVDSVGNVLGAFLRFLERGSKFTLTVWLKSTSATTPPRPTTAPMAAFAPWGMSN